MTVSNLVNNPQLKNHTLTKHIIENHINIEDSELIERFEADDKSTKLYSKFSSVETAKKSISTALTENVTKIKKWNNSGNGMLKIRFRSNTHIGYGFNRDGQKYELSWLTIVLCKNKTNGFRIKTAFPS